MFPLVPEISVTELSEDTAFVDVREAYEWQAGHIDGALHIPMNELVARLAELPDTEPLVIVCRSGNRSGRVVAWLNNNGRNTINLTGGMQAWAKAGKHMVSETGHAPLVA